MRGIPALRRITGEDLEPLVFGVSLLGSGGGGDAATFAHVLRRRLADGALRVIEPSRHPDALVAPIGVVGATRVFAEKLPGGREFVEAVAAAARWTGLEPDAVMSLEVGGLNGLSGPVAALDLGLPYVDADLMGRAMPRLDQFTWAACGHPMTPCVLREPGGQTLLVDGSDPRGLERSVRAFLAEAGGWAAFALPPIQARHIAERCVTGGLARAARLGRAALALPPSPDRSALGAALGGRVLGAGRVIEVGRHGIVGGFARGDVIVRDSDHGAVIRLETENEYLLALVDGAPVASCPDLLCLVDRRSVQPLAVDDVRVGDEVAVLVLPGPSWWSRGPHLARVAPRAFGLDCDPVLLAEAA